MLDEYKVIAIIAAIVLILLITVLTSRTRIVRTYDKYMHVNNQANLTGEQLAVLAKDVLGLKDLKFALTKNKLGDAYSPKYKTLIISEEVCNTASLSSMAIVSHELGHATQDKESTVLFCSSRLFTMITRLTNKFIIPLLIVGLFLYLFKYPNESLGAYLMITSGILFAIHVLNQILNIPLEYNASSRALKFLKKYQLLSPSEYRKAKHLLNIAAQTYIAGLLDGLFIFNKKKK